MTRDEQFELLKITLELYAYKTQDYDYGYAGRKALLTIASQPKDEVIDESGREL